MHLDARCKQEPKHSCQAGQWFPRVGPRAWEMGCLEGVTTSQGWAVRKAAYPPQSSQHSHQFYKVSGLLPSAHVSSFAKTMLRLPTSFKKKRTEASVACTPAHAPPSGCDDQTNSMFPTIDLSSAPGPAAHVLSEPTAAAHAVPW